MSMISILFYIVSCEYGEIRLVGGSTEYEGHVEICIDNQWGTVCDNDWGTSDAQVVCSQLGMVFDSGTKVCFPSMYMFLILFILLVWTGQTLPNVYFSQGSGPIFLDSVACSGTESTLLSCNSSKVGDNSCVHTDDVGVRCSGIMCTVLRSATCTLHNQLHMKLPVHVSN